MITFGATLIATKTGNAKQDGLLKFEYDKWKGSVGQSIPGVTAAYDTPSAFAVVHGDSISKWDGGRLPAYLADRAPGSKIILLEEHSLTADQVEEMAQRLSYLA